MVLSEQKTGAIVFIILNIFKCIRFLTYQTSVIIPTRMVQRKLESLAFHLKEVIIHGTCITLRGDANYYT